MLKVLIIFCTLLYLSFYSYLFFLKNVNFSVEYTHHNDTKITKDYYIKARTGAENRSKILQIRREKGL